MLKKSQSSILFGPCFFTYREEHMWWKSLTVNNACCFWHRVILKQSDAPRSLFLRHYIPGNTGYTAGIAEHQHTC